MFSYRQHTHCGDNFKVEAEKATSQKSQLCGTILPWRFYKSILLAIYVSRQCELRNRCESARGCAMEKTKQVIINREWCKGCGICVAFCPKEVLEINEDGKVRWAHPDKCIRCTLCELRCPDLAVELDWSPSSKGREIVASFLKEKGISLAFWNQAVGISFRRPQHKFFKACGTPQTLINYYRSKVFA